jgi:hypothetical protein
MHDLLRQTFALPAPACTPGHEVLAAIMRSFEPSAAVAAPRPRRTAAVRKTRASHRK